MSIDDLNELVRHGDIDEFIRVCEARQCKALSKVADEIVARNGGSWCVEAEEYLLAHAPRA